MILQIKDPTETLVSTDYFPYLHLLLTVTTIGISPLSALLIQPNSQQQELGRPIIPPPPPPWEPSVFLLTCSDRYQQPQAIGTLQKAGRDLLFKKVSRKNPSILYQLALIFGIVLKSLIIKNFKLKNFN